MILMFFLSSHLLNWLKQNSELWRQKNKSSDGRNWNIGQSFIFGSYLDFYGRLLCLVNLAARHSVNRIRVATCGRCCHVVLWWLTQFTCSADRWQRSLAQTCLTSEEDAPAPLLPPCGGLPTPACRSPTEVRIWLIFLTHVTSYKWRHARESRWIFVRAAEALLLAVTSVD